MKAATTPRLFTRRDFIRSSSALTAVVLGGPFIAPGSVFGQNAPSKRITLGVIGCGNQSTVDLPEWLKLDDCQIVAVCDVNRASRGYRYDTQFLGREPQRDFMEKAFAQKTASGTFKGVTAYADFREVLARRAGRTRRGRPPHREPLPFGQHRDAPPPQDPLGSEERGNSRRRRSHEDDRAPDARPVELRPAAQDLRQLTGGLHHAHRRKSAALPPSNVT
jgi:hypothetical protein